MDAPALAAHPLCTGIDQEQTQGNVAAFANFIPPELFNNFIRG